MVVTLYKVARSRSTLSGRENKPEKRRQKEKGREIVYAGEKREKRENIFSGKEAGLACRVNAAPSSGRL